MFYMFYMQFPFSISTQGANLAGQQLTGRLGTRKGPRLGAFQELRLGIPKIIRKRWEKIWENHGKLVDHP